MNHIKAHLEKGRRSYFLQEYGPDGKMIGVPLDPFESRLHFTCKSLLYVKSFDIREEVKLKDSLYNSETIKISEEMEFINGDAQPGYFHNEGHFVEGPEYQILGMDKTINKFQISIYPNGVESDEERLKILLVHEDLEKLSLSKKRDLSKTEAVLYFFLYLSKSRFSELCRLLTLQPSVICFSFKDALGFYSYFTERDEKFVKLLSEDVLEHIEISEGCFFKPTELGRVGSFSLSIGMEYRPKLQHP